jgi:hypothetical protein
MSKSNHPAGPVPPGNRPHAGPAFTPKDDAETPADSGAAFSEQDPKRRLGGYQTAGEAARVQPGPLNDGDAPPT